MSQSTTGRTLPSAGQPLVIEWMFDAPRELVWAAWTEPDRFVRWWGPHGFTTPHLTIDLRPGGKILFCMRSEGRQDVWAGGVFQEVTPPERLIFTDHFADEQGNAVSPQSYGMSADHPQESLITVTLDDVGGKTRLTLVHTIPSTAREQAGAREGWSESFEKLAGELAGGRPGRDGVVDETTTGTAERELVIERAFDAPREAVWEAWTEPEAVVQWFGPRGFTTTVREMDVRPGGVWRFIMHGPDGTDYHNKVVFEEVVEPERLVYSHGADDDSDFSPFHVTATFTDEGGRTRVRLRMVFATPADRDNAIEYGAKEGGTQTLERLGEYLAKSEG